MCASRLQRTDDALAAIEEIKTFIESSADERQHFDNVRIEQLKAFNEVRCINFNNFEETRPRSASPHGGNGSAIPRS